MRGMNGHIMRNGDYFTGFDHGAGHPLLFLDDAKAPNCQKNNGFNGLGNYSEWPKVAGAVIKATLPFCGNSQKYPKRFGMPGCFARLPGKTGFII